jgi:hypothetical protein
MGLDINAALLLLEAHRQGAAFKRVLTLGRLSLNVYPSRLAQILAARGLPNDVFRRGAPECAFAEPFFRALGAQAVDALDASGFEGARFVHDLNLPIPESWRATCDVVVDGGTLEHIFQFPTALKNAMELVKPGGRLFIQTCANNLCGHGFYQFSPELFHRALSSQNGYEVERMIIHRVGPYGRWREVSDPEKIRERVELITFTPMHLMVQARRVKESPIFASAPQQSDYTALWQAATPGAPTPPVPTRVSFPRLARLIHVARTGLEFYRRQSLSNRRFFRSLRKPR